MMFSYPNILLIRILLVPTCWDNWLPIVPHIIPDFQSIISCLFFVKVLPLVFLLQVVWFLIAGQLLPWWFVLCVCLFCCGLFSAAPDAEWVGSGGSRPRTEHEGKELQMWDITEVLGGSMWGVGPRT